MACDGSVSSSPSVTVLGAACDRANATGRASSDGDAPPPSCVHDVAPACVGCSCEVCTLNLAPSRSRAPQRVRCAAMIWYPQQLCGLGTLFTWRGSAVLPALPVAALGALVAGLLAGFASDALSGVWSGSAPYSIFAVVLGLLLVVRCAALQAPLKLLLAFGQFPRRARASRRRRRSELQVHHKSSPQAQPDL